MKLNFAVYILAAFFSVALFVDFLPIAPPDLQDIDNLMAGPSYQHLMGTDQLGRDVLSRILFGARISLAIGIVSALVSLSLGVSYGVLSAWNSSKLDLLLMRLLDVLMSIPTAILFILTALVFRQWEGLSQYEWRSVLEVVLALGITSWFGLARVVRGQVLKIKKESFIEAARASGAPELEIILKHVLPQLVGPVLVLLTLQIPANILFESFLSFIGLGVQAPHASWGNLANDGWRAKSYPHLILFPGVVLFTVTYLLQSIGDKLSQRLSGRLSSSPNF